ncbi:hypothetical protein, partial [Bradyrhizobium sp. 76]|uniref:hypothetical protein n=1 Tax=Bradyrhizobium sp. 76 TaxID=2782680 RepID=UPI001FF8F375
SAPWPPPADRPVDRNETHSLAGHSFADRLGVGNVRLAPFREQLYVNRQDQRHIMTERRNLTRTNNGHRRTPPTDQTRRNLFEKRSTSADAVFD